MIMRPAGMVKLSGSRFGGILDIKDSIDALQQIVKNVQATPWWIGIRNEDMNAILVEMNRINNELVSLHDSGLLTSDELTRMRRATTDLGRAAVAAEKKAISGNVLVQKIRSTTNSLTAGISEIGRRAAEPVTTDIEKRAQELIEKVKSNILVLGAVGVGLYLLLK